MTFTWWGALSDLLLAGWVGWMLYITYLLVWRVPRAQRRRDVKMALVRAVEGAVPFKVQQQIWAEYWREAYNEDWQERG